MGNPWNIQSIFELQYFNCPSCVFKDSSKQEIIYHAFDYHPESIEYLANINDESLMDIICPWKLIEIKKEEVFDTNEGTVDPLYDPSMVEVNMKMEYSEQSPKMKQSDYVDCGICGKSMTHKYLSEHIKTVHEGIKEHKCNFCGKFYSQKSSLNLHVKTFHKDMAQEKTENKGQVECNFCGKFYSNKSSLNLHVKSFHKDMVTEQTENKEQIEKQTNCDFCGKSFKRSFDLKKHVRAVHEGIKDLKCEICLTYSPCFIQSIIQIPKFNFKISLVLISMLWYPKYIDI